MTLWPTWPARNGDDPRLGRGTSGARREPFHPSPNGRPSPAAVDGRPDEAAGDDRKEDPPASRPQGPLHRGPTARQARSGTRAATDPRDPRSLRDPAADL